MTMCKVRTYLSRYLVTGTTMEMRLNRFSRQIAGQMSVQVVARKASAYFGALLYCVVVASTVSDLPHSTVTPPLPCLDVPKVPMC